VEGPIPLRTLDAATQERFAAGRGAAKVLVRLLADRDGILLPTHVCAVAAESLSSPPVRETLHGQASSEALAVAAAIFEHLPGAGLDRLMERYPRPSAEEELALLGVPWLLQFLLVSPAMDVTILLKRAIMGGYGLPPSAMAEAAAAGRRLSRDEYIRVVAWDSGFDPTGFWLRPVMLGVAALAITARFFPGAACCRAAYSALASSAVLGSTLLYYVLHHLVQAFRFRTMLNWQDALPDYCIYQSLVVTFTGLSSPLPHRLITAILLLRMSLLLLGRPLRCAVVGPSINGWSGGMLNALMTVFVLGTTAFRRRRARLPSKV